MPSTMRRSIASGFCRVFFNRLSRVPNFFQFVAIFSLSPRFCVIRDPFSSSSSNTSKLEGRMMLLLLFEARRSPWIVGAPLCLLKPPRPNLSWLAALSNSSTQPRSFSQFSSLYPQNDDNFGSDLPTPLLSPFFISRFLTRFVKPSYCIFNLDTGSAFISTPLLYTSSANLYAFFISKNSRNTRRITHAFAQYRSL